MAIEKQFRQRIQFRQVELALAELLAQTLQRGFHGAVKLELDVNDGVIQELRRIVEQVERNREQGSNERESD